MESFNSPFYLSYGENLMNLFQKLKLWCFPPPLTWKEAEEVFAFFYEHELANKLWESYSSGKDGWDVNSVLTDYLNEHYFFDADYDSDDGKCETVSLTVAHTLYSEKMFLKSPYDRNGYFDKSYYMNFHEERDDFMHETLDHLLDDTGFYKFRPMWKIRCEVLPMKQIEAVFEKLDGLVYDHFVKKFAEDYIKYVEGGDINVSPKN